MSTHLKAPSTPNPGEPEKPTEEKKRAFDLSVTQIAGGALAAMTAAALGSTLGLAGTIAGAAVASIVAGVAGTLYTASLRTGRERVRTAFRGSTDAGTAPSPRVESASTAVSTRAIDETQVLLDWDILPLEKPVRRDPGEPKRSGGSFPWKRALAVSLAVFALAAVLITGYERVSGQSFSGGAGTTVSQVRLHPAPRSRTDKDAPSTPSATPTASSTPSAPQSTASQSPGAMGAPSEDPSSPSPSTSDSTATAAPSAPGEAAAG